MLPHLKDRALVRTRYPDGILGENFYEKDSPKGAPDWVKIFTKYSASVGKDTSFLFNINLKTSLTYTIKVGSAFFPVSLYNIHIKLFLKMLITKHVGDKKRTHKSEQRSQMVIVLHDSIHV